MLNEILVHVEIVAHLKTLEVLFLGILFGRCTKVIGISCLLLMMHIFICSWYHDVLQKQWHSHWGGKGGRVPPLTAKNLPKRNNREEKAKIGKVLSLCPSWQIRLAMLLYKSQQQGFTTCGLWCNCVQFARKGSM